MTKEEWEELCGFYDKEEYLVKAIRKSLLTPEQKKLMDECGLSIEDMLNGRYGEEKEEVIFKIYDEWNEKLGWMEFGN